jgi:hypothetical protein
MLGRRKEVSNRLMDRKIHVIPCNLKTRQAKDRQEVSFKGKSLMTSFVKKRSLSDSDAVSKASNVCTSTLKPTDLAKIKTKRKVSKAPADVINKSKSTLILPSLQTKLNANGGNTKAQVENIEEMKNADASTLRPCDYKELTGSKLLTPSFTFSKSKAKSIQKSDVNSQDIPLTPNQATSSVVTETTTKVLHMEILDSRSRVSHAQNNVKEISRLNHSYPVSSVKKTHIEHDSSENLSKHSKIDIPLCNTRDLLASVCDESAKGDHVVRDEYIPELETSERNPQILDPPEVIESMSIERNQECRPNVTPTKHCSKKRKTTSPKQVLAVARTPPSSQVRCPVVKANSAFLPFAVTTVTGDEEYVFPRKRFDFTQSTSESRNLCRIKLILEHRAAHDKIREQVLRSVSHLIRWFTDQRVKPTDENVMRSLDRIMAAMEETLVSSIFGVIYEMNAPP